MAYIGRGTDKISNIEKLDVITFDGSQSYTLQKNSVNFVPNSANSLQVSIDGVVQAGNFTVSGSTIDFGVAVASTSTCDFIMHFGTGVTTQPSDGSVTDAKLAASAINSQTAVTSLADSDEFLVYDASATALKKVTKANLGVANTPAFFVSLSADQSISGASTETKVQFNTELFDTDNCYDNSTNYRFTPTTAGKYALFTSVNVFTSSGDWNQYYVEINKNGTRIALSAANYSTNVIGGGDSMTIPVHAIADANGTTDYFDVFFSCNNANGKANGDSNTFTNFYGYKLIGV